MIDKRTGDVSGSKVGYTCYNEKCLVNFTVFVDHKIACCQVKALYALNGVDTQIIVIFHKISSLPLPLLLVQVILLAVLL